MAALALALPVLNAQGSPISFYKINVPQIPSEIFCGTVDDQGFVWIGKVDGLFRFNGTDFELFKSDPLDSTALTSGRPVCLYSGSHRDLWVGSFSGGISRLDLNTNKFKSFRHSVIDSNTIGGNSIGGIYVDQENIAWVGSDDFCLNRLDWQSNSVKRYYPNTINKTRQFSNYLGKIVPDSRNPDILWIGAPHGVYRFSKQSGQFKLFEFDAYMRPYKPYPVPVYVDTDGIVWAGASSNAVTGFARIDPQENNIEIIPLLSLNPDGLPGWSTSAIEHFSDDEIVVVTRGGLIVVNRKTRDIWQLSEDNVQILGANFYVRDSIGNTWSSGAERRQTTAKLLRSPPAHIQARSEAISFRPLTGHNWSRSYLAQPGKNALWIGTLQGAGLLYVDTDKRSVRAHTFQLQPLFQKDVFMRDLVWGPQGHINIASDGGLLRFDTLSKTFDKIVDQTDRYQWRDISSVCQCIENTWFSSVDEGLFAIDAEHSDTLVYYSNMAESITDLVCQDSTLWVATATGLFSLNQLARNASPVLILPDHNISQLLVHDQKLWAATMSFGLLSVDSAQSVQYHINKGAQGTNTIFALTVARNGIFWLNTDGGTVSFNRQTDEYVNLLEFGPGKRSPILELPNGRMVAGRYNGIHHFLPSDFTTRALAPKLYFTKIDIANRPEKFDLAPDLIEKVTLQPNERELVVEFNAINYNAATMTNFRYRISGVVDEWQDIGTQRYLNFNNLSRGTHILEIKGLNIYGGESITPKTLEIIVLPRFHQLLWVRIFAIIFILTISWAFIQFIKQRREKQLHDETVQYFANSRYAENSVDEILWDVSRNVISRLNLEDCVVYLADADNHELVQKAAYGEKNRQGREILDPLVIPFGKGIVGTAAESQKSVLCADVTTDARYIPDISVKGSELAVPIIHQGITIGVIDSEHRKTGFFRKAHAVVFERIAKECAHKIATAKAAEEIELRKRNLLSVQKEVAELKLTALQAQMNPHFIFNSLNSINWYILKNKPAEASIYLTKFSKLVRLILDNSKNLSIPLDKELDALKLYLDLESMRFEDTFEYEFQTDDAVDMEEVMIPPLILQPFVENAIWHGLMHKNGKGTLLIQIYPENGHLKCIVQDDGIGRRASERLKSSGKKTHESKGLKLTTDRIKLIHQDYLKENTIRIIDLVSANGEAAGTRVEVLLPYD